MMEEGLKIVQVIARLNIGGPALYVILLTKGLLDRGHQTVLICGKVEPYEGDMAFVARRTGIEPLYLARFGRRISILSDIKAFIGLRKVIKRFCPHIVHTHTAKAGTLGRLAVLSVNIFRKRRKIRTVHTFHGNVFRGYFGPKKTIFFRDIERILARMTDMIVAISPSQKEELCEHLKIADEEKIVVIPLGLDLSKYAKSDQLRERGRQKYLSRGSSKFLVAAIGRLTGIKNHRLLLEAISLLEDKGEARRFQFMCVGDGELKRELIDLTEKLNIQHRVIFTGWEKDMSLVYGAIDLLVLTSKNEGTPVTMIEAMAAGRPVVATNVGGVRDLIGKIEEVRPEGFCLGKRGILVPPGDTSALAEALLFVEKNPITMSRIAVQAKEFVLEKYDVVRSLDNIMRLYQELEYGVR